jgi:hypothetical protein
LKKGGTLAWRGAPTGKNKINGGGKSPQLYWRDQEKQVLPSTQPVRRWSVNKSIFTKYHHRSNLIVINLTIPSIADIFRIWKIASEFIQRQMQLHKVKLSLPVFIHKV